MDVVVDFKAVYYTSVFFFENQNKQIHSDGLWGTVHCPTIAWSISTWFWRTKRNFHLRQEETSTIEVTTALNVSSK
jgi:hypothetical protein